MVHAPCVYYVKNSGHAGGTYEVMGTRMECKFNLFNTCDVSKQTVCVEN